eukprot:TRINITY_DN2763_c0_g1_i1.p1 TRINITY_DN2763_c0_g1~~TRINITY_DN2763_c0_g1_i1.p1  ORF type:complete len:130 (-),score=32.88 TRINITY_DN2763_c0_g1_i1:182-571(-)
MASGLPLEVVLYYLALHAGMPDCRCEITRMSEIPYGTVGPFMQILYDVGREDKVLMHCTMGAPSLVLSMCGGAFTAWDRKALQREAKRLASRVGSNRATVLAVANGIDPTNQTFIGFVALRLPPSPFLP